MSKIQYITAYLVTGLAHNFLTELIAVTGIRLINSSSSRWEGVYLYYPTESFINEKGLLNIEEHEATQEREIRKLEKVIFAIQAVTSEYKTGVWIKRTEITLKDNSIYN